MDLSSYLTNSHPRVNALISELETALNTLLTHVETYDDAEIGLGATEGTRFAKVAVATYDFATHGGDVSTISLGVALPDNAYITKVAYHIITPTNSAGETATIKLTLPTDGDLCTAIAKAADTSAIESTVTFPVITTAARNLSVKIDTAALTAGKIKFFVEYYQSI